MTHPHDGERSAPYREPPAHGFTSQYTGLGTFGGGGYGQGAPQPNPGGRRNLVVALSALVLVLVLGGITAVVLINRGSADQPGAAGTGASGTNTASQARKNWQQITSTANGVSFQVPDSWELQENAIGWAGALQLSDIAVAEPFECQGRSMIQGQIGAGTSSESNATVVATTAAQALATTSYSIDGKAPTLSDPAVSPIQRDGVSGVVVTVEATTTEVSACFAPKGQVTAVALQHGTGTSLVVVNVALGGPHADTGPTQEDLRQIAASVRPLD